MMADATPVSRRSGSRDDPELLGSIWRDKHGNTYRVYSVSYMGTNGPEVRLELLPPLPTTGPLTLADLEQSHERV